MIYPACRASARTTHSSTVIVSGRRAFSISAAVRASCDRAETRGSVNPFRIVPICFRRFENAFQGVSRMILESDIEKVMVQGKTTYNFKLFSPGGKHIIDMDLAKKFSNP